MLSDEAINLLKWFNEGETLFKRAQRTYARAFEELEQGEFIFLANPRKVGRHSIITVHLTEKGREVLEAEEKRA